MISREALFGKRLVFNSLESLFNLFFPWVDCLLKVNVSFSQWQASLALDMSIFWSHLWNDLVDDCRSLFNFSTLFCFLKHVLSKLFWRYVLKFDNFRTLNSLCCFEDPIFCLLLSFTSLLTISESSSMFSKSSRVSVSTSVAVWALNLEFDRSIPESKSSSNAFTFDRLVLKLELRIGLSACREVSISSFWRCDNLSLGFSTLLLRNCFLPDIFRNLSQLFEKRLEFKFNFSNFALGFGSSFTVVFFIKATLFFDKVPGKCFDVKSLGTLFTLVVWFFVFTIFPVRFFSRTISLEFSFWGFILSSKPLLGVRSGYSNELL